MAALLPDSAGRPESLEEGKIALGKAESSSHQKRATSQRRVDSWTNTANSHAAASQGQEKRTCHPCSALFHFQRQVQHLLIPSISPSFLPLSPHQIPVIIDHRHLSASRGESVRSVYTVSACTFIRPPSSGLSTLDTPAVALAWRRRITHSPRMLITTFPLSKYTC